MRLKRQYFEQSKQIKYFTIKYLHFHYLILLINTGVIAVTQTDRPKSIRNRCVIEVFVSVFYVVVV